MGSRELTEWMAYYSLEPFGPLALNVNFGQLLQMTYMTNRAEDAPKTEVKDWVLGEHEEEAPKKQDLDAMEGILMTLVKGGRKNKDG